LFELVVLQEKLKLVVIRHVICKLPQNRELIAKTIEFAGIFFFFIAFYLFKFGLTRICSTRRLSEAALPLEDWLADF
jgi:hypothetical protein